MVTLNDIIEVVSLICKVSITNIKSKKRYRAFSEARGLYFVCAREFTRFGVIEIAKFVNRSHGTCSHYCKDVPLLMKYDKGYRMSYNEIVRNLNIIKTNSNENNADILKQIDVQIKELLDKKRHIISSEKRKRVYHKKSMSWKNIRRAKQ